MSWQTRLINSLLKSIQEDNTDNFSVEVVKYFVCSLNVKFKELEVMQDERLSEILTFQSLLNGEARQKARNNEQDAYLSYNFALMRAI